MSTWDPYSAPLSAYTPGQGDPSMEGGWQTASGAPMYTLEQYLNGQAPYVTGATNRKPTGEIVQRTVGNQTVPIHLSDYGPGVKGIDVASSNPEWATNFPYQGQTDVPQGTITDYGASQVKPNETMYTTPSGQPMMGSANPAGMSTWQDYYNAPTTSPYTTVGNSVGKGFHQAGQQIQQSANNSTQQALQMLNTKSDPVLAAYAQNPLLALLQMYQLTGRVG